MSRLWLYLYLALCVCLLSSSAAADVQRFAVIVGNNQGQGQDVQLRYAESDAAKVARVLRDLGGFKPADVVVLQSESASTVRSTLITVNDRVRAAQALPNMETLLFVYYSGHADAQALRLGSSKLEFRELAELVRGSPAQVRLLVVDACRSGALTRVKGGNVVAPFALSSSSLKGEGMAFLTASAANEDAQESDALRGSFFTHAFVSGLLGAADKNRNGEVALEEAYAHAYDATIRSTSRTFAGTQHPAFRYEVKGQGSLVLTRPGAVQAQRAVLAFPKGFEFVVMATNEGGVVLGEIGGRDASRTLSLPPGRFFLRGRGPDYLLEGAVSVGAGQKHQVDPTTLDRVAYARLVRKGTESDGLSHALELGFSVRSELPNANTPCLGGLFGYRLQFENFGLEAQLGVCTSSFHNEALDARTNEYAFTFGVTHTWDLEWLSLFGGIGLGTTLTHQNFDTVGEAPARFSLSPVGYLSGGATVSLSERIYAGLEGRLEAHLMQLQESAVTESELRAEPAARGSALVGLEF